VSVLTIVRVFGQMCGCSDKCVGVLVICILVFTLLLYCLFVFYHLCIFILIFPVCTD
jgi:hypothetical protein